MVHIWNKSKVVSIIPHIKKEMNDYSLTTTKILRKTSDSMEAYASSDNTRID